MLFRILALAAMLAAPSILPDAPAFAHNGDDHGAPVQTVPAAPLAAAGMGAEGEFLQAVLTPLEKEGRTVLFLADADTNAPVSEAEIAVEAGGWSGKAAATTTAGVYTLAWLPPVKGADATLMIEAGGRGDLLLIQGVRLAPPAAGPDGSTAAHWTHWTGGALIGAIAALILLAFKRREAASAALIVLLSSGDALAHGGEDHSQAEGVAASSPGALLNMPKATQFLLGIRTIRVEATEAANTVRVLGRVMPDPAGYARVQPSQPARVIFDPANPIPVPGQSVKRGQILAVLEPTLSTLEKGDKRAALSRVDGDLAIAERDMARETSLGDLVSAKQRETTRIRVEQLRKERGQITGTALGRELLVAPVDGVVTDVHVVPGEVVTTERALVEIINPAQLRIEAIVHDLALAGRIAGATATTKLLPNHSFALTRLGISPRVDAIDQGVHAVFAVDPVQAPLLRVGLPVDVHLATGAARLRTAVPRDAVTESGGRQVVFVRTAPEQFEARPVIIHQVVGPLAEVHGIIAGERIVVQGVEQMKAVR